MCINNSTLNCTVYILIYLYLGATSLNWAAQNGWTDTIKLLLDQGANVSTMNNDGKKDNNTYIHMPIPI